MPVENEDVSTQLSNVLKDEKQQSGQRHPSRQGKARQVYLYSTFHTQW